MGDLGLPSDYDPRFIPSSSRLQKASEKGLETWTSFIMTNKDSPQIIADKIDEIVKVIDSALEVDGPHVPKALKLGLELEMRYWVYDNRLQDWLNFMVHMLEKAIELGDAALISEVYRAWSIYLYVTREQAKAKKAIESALEYANDTDQEPLKLSVRAERFNLYLHDLSLKDAQAEAERLIEEADRLRFPYVKGRAYLTLALKYQMLVLPAEAFTAAQQALTCFAAPEIIGMQAYAVSLMLGNLQVIQVNAVQMPAYRMQLLNYLTMLISHSVNPQFKAAVAHLQANEAYYLDKPIEARRHALIAWLNYRNINHDTISSRDIQHVLGMIENKLDHPALAERHLRAAISYFQAVNETLRQIYALHALAWVPYMHGDPLRATAFMDEALALIDRLPEPQTQESLRTWLQADRAKIEQAAQDAAS
jgi:tetratricopeptide (TPR) repeat protein